MSGKFSTSYGSLPGGKQGSSLDDYEANEPRLGTHGEATENSMLSRCIKPTLLAAGLVLISLGAVSFSQYSGYSFQPMDFEKSSSSSSSSANGDSVSRPVFATLADYEKEALFRNFVDSYGKTYKTDEYTTKLGIFKDFLELCDARNMAEAAAGGEGIHGVTKFADQSQKEFEESLGYSETTASLEPVKPTISAYTGTATSVDWTDSYVTSIKDQGYCGSCWAFSAVSQVESDAIRMGLLSSTDSLSTQQVVSCDAIDAGCSGGDTEQAYQYMKENGGISGDIAYPYASSTGTTDACDSTLSSTIKVSITNFATLRDESVDAAIIETNMMNYVKSTGPLSVCLDASTWSTYVSGIVSMCGTTVDHCVQVVAVDTEEGSWKIRNQWGTDWGESGYIRLKYGQDTCSITYDPTFTYPASSSDSEVDTTKADDGDDDEPADEDDAGDEVGGDDAKPNDDVPVPADVDDVAPSDDKNVPPETDDDEESGPPAGDDEEVSFVSSLLLPPSNPPVFFPRHKITQKLLSLLHTQNDMSPSEDDDEDDEDDDEDDDEPTKDDDEDDDDKPSKDDEVPTPDADDEAPDAKDDEAPAPDADDAEDVPPTTDDGEDGDDQGPSASVKGTKSSDSTSTKSSPSATTLTTRGSSKAEKTSTSPSTSTSTAKKSKTSKKNSKES